MAQSDAPNVPEREEQELRAPLTKMSAKVWPGRTDTRAIVGALMLSLTMIVILRIAEPIDTIVTGGLFPVSGRVIAFTMIALGTWMFGGIGGFIVAEINPFIGVATGSSPIAPFFFITNGLITVAAIIVGSRVSDVTSWKSILAFTTLASVFLILVYIPLHLLYFQLPVERMLSLYAVQTAASIPLPALLLRALLRVIRSAGFVRR
jgi:hypothetical protein